MLSAVSVGPNTNPLNPRVGTKITGHGLVVRRDVTRFRLHRMVVAQRERYPDLEIWCEIVKDKKLLLHWYQEKLEGNGLVCYLWLFWKE